VEQKFGCSTDQPSRWSDSSDGQAQTLATEEIDSAIDGQRRLIDHCPVTLSINYIRPY